MPKASKSKKKTIKNTGERMVPEFSEGGLEYGEHMVRYEAALPLVKNKLVLDIASGSGYGTAMLGTTAKQVTGVDYDKDAIAYATTTYGKPNTKYVQGSATAIPLGDNSVDVVVSFETLEHIEDYEKFIKEIKRVLKKDGLLILSTPNDKEFPEGAHYHIHEFERKELEKLVAKYFKNTKSYFQATWKYNALVEEADLQKKFTMSIPTTNLAPVDTNKALYFYMLCANRPVTEAVEPVAAISEHWSTRDMLEHNAKMDKYIRDVIKHYKGIIEVKDKELASLNRTSLVRQARRLGGKVKRKAKSLQTKR